MKILNPEENIASVISLINNAKEFVVIVSPFNDLAGWDDLINAINESKNRVKVSYYVRKDEGRTGIEEIKADIYEVPLLHAKMFFSESEAIISSGNLTNHPDINWFCRLNKAEYDDITDFFERYIKPGATQLL
jgi:hypothetical protein